MSDNLTDGLKPEFPSKDLKRTLREHEKVITRLQNERRLSGTKSYARIRSYSSDSLILRDNVALILKTAKAIRTTESVPSYDERRPEASISSTNTVRSSRISIRGNRQPSQDRPHFYSASLPDNIMGSSHAYVGGESLEADVRMPPSTGSPIIGKPARSRRDSLISQSQSPQVHTSPVTSAPDSLPSEAIGLHEPKSGISPSSVPSHSNTQGLINSTQSEHLNVRPLDDVLKMVKSSKSEPIFGYLEGPNRSWFPVSGTLEPEQEFSFIPATLASEMNLLEQVEQYTGEDGEIWILSYGGRMIKPIGRTCVRWRTAHIPSRPVSVLFWVFDYHRERDIVLGKEVLSRIRPNEHKAGEIDG